MILTKIALFMQVLALMLMIYGYYSREQYLVNVALTISLTATFMTFISLILRKK